MASPAFAAAMWMPTTRPVPTSATILTIPRVSRLTIARGTYANGSTRHVHSSPASATWASVRPTEARLGLVKVTRGRCE